MLFSWNLARGLGSAAFFRFPWTLKKVFDIYVGDTWCSNSKLSRNVCSWNQQRQLSRRALAGSSDVRVRSSDAAPGTRALSCASVFVLWYCAQIEMKGYHYTPSKGDRLLGATSFPYTLWQCEKIRKKTWSLETSHKEIQITARKQLEEPECLQRFLGKKVHRCCTIGQCVKKVMKED